MKKALKILGAVLLVLVGVTRPRLANLIFEEQDGVRHQLRAIIDFRKQHPQVDVVVSHDIPAMERRFQSGAVAKGY